MQLKMKKISGDASFREFYRIQKNPGSSILVKANKDRYKNLIVYAAINQFLLKNNVKAPKLIKEYFHHNMMEIEDLGRFSFLDFIKNKKNKYGFYKKLIDIVIKLQNLKLKKFISFKRYKIRVGQYNLKQLHKESDLFFDWYLKNSIKKNKFNYYKKKIKQELNQLYKNLYFQNKCFVHKDFHASNIMLNKNKLALIDSQDAIKGNLFYDLASVIDDVRIKIPADLKSLLFKYYMSKTDKIKLAEFKFAKNDFDILSIQRNLKILGIFVRLSLRDKKNNYLRLLPYTWRLIELRLNNPIFSRLKMLLKDCVSLKMRKKIKFYAN
jgi:N-acetylmuramate 1-kinase